MSKSSPGFEMIDLQNIIDSEFEVIKKSNDCSRSTDSLFNRVDVLSVQQCKLRSFLESLDARLKQAKEMQNENGRILPSEKVCSMSGDSTPVTTTEMLSVDHQFVRSVSSIDGPVSQAAHPQSIRTRSESLERKSIGGGRNSPIVIDDEEDISRSTMAGLTRLSEQAIPVPATTHSTLLPKQQEALLTNVRRRSLIIEKTPENQAYVNKNFALAALARSTWSAEASSSLRSLKTTIRRLSGNETPLSPTGVTLPVRTRESSSVPIPTPSNTEATGSSTESASSSLNERSQSPTTEVGDVISWQQTAEYRDENASPLSTGSTPVSTGRILRNTESRSSTKISRTVSPRPHSPADFKVGSRVFGKRSSDIWFPGEITKTMPDKNKQTKYSIKYDKGQKGVLSLNHICPETHAVVEELSVGSRVVGLYGRLDIWYAGIVAEVPCGDNRNRFLIFFDDGFAQYLSVKKLHKVHHKGKNVWEDVAEHSRDFIQEYLEDYPSRPMLHVRVGQWIRTEWKGEWLKAKVLSVDGSLVKMLFQIDNRSEWIYRGSTRLDPLYRALVLGEKKTTSAKARSRKLTRNTSKGNTPYIEYNITKAAFGISPYSKTDPKGVQQLQLEEQRKITQLQQQPREVAKSAKVNVAPFRGKQPNKTTDVVNKAVKLTENKILPELEENWKTKSPANNSQGKPSVPLTPVIESTYSCIQASTMRKKTGASLANSVIFNAVDVKVQEPAPVTSSANLNSADVQLVHAEKSNEKTVEEKKLKGGKWKAPWLNLDERSKLRHSTDNVIKPETIVNTQKPRDVAAILKNKFDASAVNVKDDPASVRKPSSALNLETVRTITGPHTCSTTCSRHRRGFVVNPLRHNPLAVPLLLDWRREIVKRRGKTNKRDVYYRSPCHRRLRNLGEVFQYLRLTKEKTLEIDQFTFDWRVRTKDMGQSAPIVDDISCGLEDRPIAAVNDVNNERPPDVKYVRERQLAPGVELSADPGFMVCCDCNDDCSDSTKCACIQLTIQGSKAVDGKDGDKATYHYKRLKDCIQTGIYECNPRCSCSKRCLNRVVQNGIQVRIEVFKTENRGWGLRAVDDIPAGTFICTYAGHLLNEDLANQDGRDYGDEYMAELDYIEVAEKAKEGYESGVSDLEEDDNVINEMLQFDENLSDSDNSGRSSHNEESVDVDVDDSDDSDDEDEDEEEENDDVPSSSGENCSLSSGDENSLSQRRKTLRSSKRKKVFKSQQKKKRGTLSEESLVVERESKASVLSHLADSLMCTLALKRNGNDLKKSTRFLQKLLTGEEDMAAEAIEISEKHKPVNGMTRQLSENTDVNDSRPTMLSSSDFDLDELSDDALLALHGNRDRLSSANNELTRSEEERDRTGEEQYIVGVEPVGNENGKADAEVFSSEKACKIVSTKINGEDSSLTKELEKEEDLDANKTVEEGIKVPKDDVPELLSADDLKRLAASEPKSMEPPVLLKAGEARRGSGLDEMIEKLKKRVVASDSGLSNSEIVPEKILVSEEMNERKDAGLTAENSTTSRLPYSKETSEDRGIVGGLSNSEKSCSVKEKEQDMDDDKRSLRSDSSFVSRNSSSVTQSVSSRCSSPSTDSIVKTGYKKRKDDRKSSLKGDKLLAANNSVSGKAVKTRLLFGEEHCYVIDAKTFGNCGRFLNHSCSPNLFVQNVFVDTHDLRFPRVAFFAQHNIKGGTELSWDYMYEVGSVQNKFLYCLCGSSECRGRLL